MSSDTEQDAGGPAFDFGPQLVVDLAGGFRHVEGIDDIQRDSQRAYWTYEAIKEADAGKFLATYDGEIYVYEDGYWHGNPDGVQKLRELSKEALFDYHSNSVLEELQEQVRANDAIHREDMGSPPGEIPAANGLINIEKAREKPYEALRDPVPEDYILSPLPVGYNPDAECPKWREFVEEVTEDGMADALQEYIGYCLMVNEWRFDRVLLLVGSGSNGKSTFLNVVTELLGTDNITGFSIGDLVHNEYHVAQMFGAVANIDADVTGGIGHGGMFKKLTGGDKKISARHPYGRPFDFAPKTKHLYSANQVPQTEVDDNAFFRRWLVVEFPNEYTDPDQPGPDKDPDLEDELLLELPGILNWALKGLHRLLDQGHFTNEGDSEEKRDRWQSWGDTVDKFIDREIETGGDQKFTTAQVYERYTTFCRQELEQSPESQRTVTDKIKKLDEVQYSSNFRFDGKKARGFKGISFESPAPDPDDASDQPNQATLADGAEERAPQEEAYELVLEAIKSTEKAHADEVAPLHVIQNRVASQVGGTDRVEHIIEQLLNKRDPPIYEPSDEKYRST